MTNNPMIGKRVNGFKIVRRIIRGDIWKGEKAKSEEFQVISNGIVRSRWDTEQQATNWALSQS